MRVAQLFLIAALTATIAWAQDHGPVVGLSADGTRLVGADGKPLVLRGVNWGWWSCVEAGDAELLRAWGGNLIRISFPYYKLVKPGTDEIGGEGLALLDNMVAWAEAARVWYILDCQETPGGCNTAHHCYGGKNALWTEAAYQDQCVAMWQTLATRYRDRKWLLAYELMNEPTPPAQFTMEQYRALLLRNIDVLRAIDPERFIVVSGWGWSDVSRMTDQIVLPRPKLLYTFHCYNPGQVTQEAATYPGPATFEAKWLGNSPENWGASGDTAWTLLEKTFTAPADATHAQVLLRSDNNAGHAWFDDLELLCGTEPVAAVANTSFGPDTRKQAWTILRKTAGDLAWNATEGCAAPGSLHITGTDSYNAWATEQRFSVRAGATYNIRCKVRTTGATGFSYPSLAWFRESAEPIDRAWLEKRLRLALDFSQRHNVPIWCGEFGCSQSNPDGSGVRWIKDVGDLLNALEIPWTHWNWRETTGRGSMAVWVQNEGRYEMQRPVADMVRQLLGPGAEGAAAP